MKPAPERGAGNLRVSAELAVAVALAAVLSLVRIKLPHLLYGGSVSCHSLPILAVAIRHGMRKGVLAGVAYGFVSFIISPYPFHPIQVVLDYPVAFGALGMAGLPGALAGVGGAGPPSRWLIIAGVLLANGLRFLCHFASGWVYFAHFAPEGVQVWRYSLFYNGSYMLPEALIGLFLMQLVLRRLNSGR
jgi:thiamine transporter